MLEIVLYVFLAVALFEFGYQFQRWNQWLVHQRQSSFEEYSRRKLRKRCADCGATIGKDQGPEDGWELEDGRIVCHLCCAQDLKKLLSSRKEK